ncbi:glycoside hydrolase family 18 protein [Amycolatopsis cihanbeyliensis]|uniref:chitinase n=1 Tax=Amycolatopsis cihanbeyliensis TaxID=1128664 RepID=A0A542DCW2_AMYCI|nr:glycoside hydrolase family 18 protein [Amycolatopsis cihanbeyliensis]TQJ00907.1 GH18 family chitinase [Amycolatopsis cihanbeyliensis]
MRFALRRRKPGAPTRLRLAIVTVASGIAIAGLAAPAPQAATASLGTHERAQASDLTVNYYPQWAVYGRNTYIGDIERNGSADGLDVLNYAFANIHATEHTCFMDTQSVGNPGDPDYPRDNAGDAHADYQRVITAGQSVDGVADDPAAKLRGNFNQLKKLKARHPDLKVLISLGGWSYSKYFADAARTEASREKFVSSCIDMFIKGNLPERDDWGTGKPAGGPGVAAGIFDGFDLDWEYPGGGGLEGNHVYPEDKQNFTLLLREFREQLDAVRSGLLLTAFTAADPVKIENGLELDKIFNYLDFANVQGYDFHGSSWEPERTGHQANIHDDPADPNPPESRFSVQQAIQIYTDAGVDPSQLLVGIPFYGRGWTGVQDGGAHGVYQQASGPAEGDFPEEPGVRGYRNLKDQFTADQIFRDEEALASWAYDGNEFWSFDDPAMVRAKTGYITAEGLGGAFAWNLAEDDGTLSAAMRDGLGS